MEKELQNLLDNYEKVIYGQAFPISPTTHQIHLLLDYIANQGVQLKKQKEINKKAIEYIKNNLIVSSILDGKKYYSLNDYGFDYKELLQILEDKEV